MPDPHDVLGVPGGADPEEIKAAFDRLSRRLPPERRAADPEAAAAFATIAAAYALLSRPERRARLEAFEDWGKGGPDVPAGPPRAAAAPRTAAGDGTAADAAADAAVDGPPELKPGEEFNFRRFKGQLCVYAGALMVARGAVAVYFDPYGWPSRLARHLPLIGACEQKEPAFLVMIMGMAAVVGGAGSFMVTDREIEELDRRAGRRRLWRRVRWRPF